MATLRYDIEIHTPGRRAVSSIDRFLTAHGGGGGNAAFVDLKPLVRTRNTGAAAKKSLPIVALMYATDACENGSPRYCVVWAPAERGSLALFAGEFRIVAESDSFVLSFSGAYQQSGAPSKRDAALGERVAAAAAQQLSSKIKRFVEMEAIADAPFFFYGAV